MLIAQVVLAYVLLVAIVLALLLWPVWRRKPEKPPAIRSITVPPPRPADPDA
jgi:hypothetical protein